MGELFEKERLNVVVVVIDALRYDRVGAYGCDRDLTPNMDDLLEDALVFETAFACSNATDPSITSIHTGRHPRATVLHHGPYVSDQEKRRVEGVQTLPEVLNANGWQTIASGRYLGRWHRNGFDEYPDTTFENRLVRLRNKLKLLHPALRVPASFGFKALGAAMGSSLSSQREHGDDIAVDAFVEAQENEPFYGFIHLMDTHTPYEPTRADVEDLLSHYDYPDEGLREFFDKHADKPQLADTLLDWATEEDHRVGIGRIYAKYDACVRKADRTLGRLIETLKRDGQWENTALFVLSDHGESLGEHGIYFDHHGLYDQTMRVPLLARIPGAEPRRVSGLVQLIDIFPTVLDLVGIDQIDVDGKSLKPLLDQDSDWNREHVVADEALTQRRTAVRTSDWKYIEHVRDERLEEAGEDSLRCRYCDTVHGGERELYELSTDPAEEHDISAENPEVIRRLQRIIRQFTADVSIPEEANTEVTYEHEESVMDRLEELGYR